MEAYRARLLKKYGAGNVAVRLWPATLQIFAMALGALAVLLTLGERPLGRVGRWLDVTLGLRTLGAFADLSATDVASRFDAAAVRAHRLARREAIDSSRREGGA